MVMSWFTDRRRDASKMNLYEACCCSAGRTVDEALSAQVEYVQDPELAVVVREMLAYHRFHNVGLARAWASQPARTFQMLSATLWWPPRIMPPIATSVCRR